MAGTAVLGSVEYAPFGPVRKWTWANSQGMERAFDEDGLIKSYTLGPSTATYSDLEQVFGYDAVNPLVSAALAAGQTQSFTYDAVSFTYDNTGSVTASAAITYNFCSVQGFPTLPTASYWKSYREFRNVRAGPR